MANYETDPRRQASEAIKDLMVAEKKSRLPLILTILVLIALLAGAGYFYSLPPEKRPTLGQVAARVSGLANALLNKPIMNPPASPSTAPTDTKKPAPSSGDSNGLLSN